MRAATVVFACIAALVLAPSCEKKAEKEETPAPAAEEQTISYTSDEVSFAVYFDAEHTRRTIELARGQEELDIYIVVHFPEYMGIAAVEYKLELPDGLTIISDSYYEKRTLMMGTFEKGISEAFPCAQGPSLQLHKLTLSIEGRPEDATIALLPGESSGMLGVAKCDEGYTEIRASSYKAVINPGD